MADLPVPEAMEPIYRFGAWAATLDALRSFAEATGADLGCRAIARRVDDGFVIGAALPQSRFEAASAAFAQRGTDTVRLTFIEDATATGRERQQEVGRGNRYAARGAIPRGLGRKV